MSQSKDSDNITTSCVTQFHVYNARMAFAVAIEAKNQFRRRMDTDSGSGKAAHNRSFRRFQTSEGVITANFFPILNHKSKLFWSIQRPSGKALCQKRGNQFKVECESLSFLCNL